MNERNESLHDQIATIVQVGRNSPKSSDEISAEIMALLAKLGFGRSAEQ